MLSYLTFVSPLARRGNTNMSMLREQILLQCKMPNHQDNLHEMGHPSCSRCWSQKNLYGKPFATSCEAACCPLCCHFIYLFIITFVALKVHEVLGHACVSHGQVCIEHSFPSPCDTLGALHIRCGMAKHIRHHLQVIHIRQHCTVDEAGKNPNNILLVVKESYSIFFGLMQHAKPSRP